MLSAFVNLMLALPFPGGKVLGLIFAGSVLLASQSPYPIYVYFLANYKPHLIHFLGKCNVCDPNLVTLYLCIYQINVVSRMECNAVNASLLLNLINNNLLIFFNRESSHNSFQSLYLAERSENLQPHSSNVSVKSKVQHAPPPGHTPGI